MKKGLEPTSSTVEHLEKLYSQNYPRLSFSAGSTEEWQKWRKELKAKLIDLLGLFPKRCGLKPQLVKRRGLGACYWEKIILQPEKGLVMPAYFLIPKKIDFAARAILVLHGHGRGVKDVLGEADSFTWRKFIEGYNYDYACKLASLPHFEKEMWCLWGFASSFSHYIPCHVFIGFITSEEILRLL